MDDRHAYKRIKKEKLKECREKRTEKKTCLSKGDELSYSLVNSPTVSGIFLLQIEPLAERNLK